RGVGTNAARGTETLQRVVCRLGRIAARAREKGPFTSRRQGIFRGVQKPERVGTLLRGVRHSGSSFATNGRDLGISSQRSPAGGVSSHYLASCGVSRGL